VPAARPTAVPGPSATVDRAAVLAFRAAAHGLDRRAGRARDVGLLAGLGVQDSPPGAARLALAARTHAVDADHGGRVDAGPAGDGDPARWEDDASLTAAWSLRGAPHVHPRAAVPALARALWPHDDADTAARLAWNATRVQASGLPPLQALALTAAAVAEVAATDPAQLDGTGLPPVERRDGELGLGKGLLSREVTRRLPTALHRWCEPCGSAHVSEQLLRLAALPGGLVVDRSAPLAFAPASDGPGWQVPAAPGDLSGPVREYLHRYGPATPADVKAFLGSTLAVLRAHWPDDVEPVAVRAGDAVRTAWALAGDVAALHDPPPAPDVRLLPPNDPFLKAGDRNVLVPDRAEQKAIWRILGAPGALLVGALPAGTWRARTSGRRLQVAVEPFAPLTPAARSAVEAEAERMATVRGLTLQSLTGA